MAEDRINASDLIDESGITGAFEKVINKLEEFDSAIHKTQTSIDNYRKEAVSFEGLKSELNSVKKSLDDISAFFGNKKLKEADLLRKDGTLDKLVNSLTEIKTVIENINASDGIRFNFSKASSGLTDLKNSLVGVKRIVDNLALSSTVSADISAGVKSYLATLKELKRALIDITQVRDSTLNFSKASGAANYEGVIQGLLTGLSKLKAATIEDFSTMSDTSSELLRDVDSLIALLNLAQDKSGRLSKTNQAELERVRRAAIDSISGSFNVISAKAKEIGIDVKGLNLDIAKSERIQAAAQAEQTKERKKQKREVKETADIQKRADKEHIENIRTANQEIEKPKRGRPKKQRDTEPAAPASYSDFGPLTGKKKKAEDPAWIAQQQLELEQRRQALIAKADQLQKEEIAAVTEKVEAEKQVVKELTEEEQLAEIIAATERRSKEAAKEKTAAVKEETIAEVAQERAVQKQVTQEQEVVKHKRKRIRHSKEVKDAQREETKATEEQVIAQTKVEKAVEETAKDQNNLNTILEGIVKKVEAAAAAMSKQAASANTTEEIKQLTAEEVAAERLKNAYFALDVAKEQDAQKAAAIYQEAQLLLKTESQHTTILRSQVGSYNQLTAKLKLYTEQYKAMEAEERTQPAGLDLLERITETAIERNKIIALMDEQAKRAKVLQKAEADLAYTTSDEAKRLAELKSEIQARNEAMRLAIQLDKMKAATAFSLGVDQSTGGTGVLASPDTNNALYQIEAYNEQIREQHRLMVLTQRLASAEAGSYNALAAEFELNKIKLREMGAEQRASNGEAQAMMRRQEELQRLMRAMQNAYAGYTDSMHRFGNSWNGLTFSITQVIREIPAAAVSLNTFFLAISNNIPMVLDEVQRVRALNKEAVARGDEAISVWKSVAKSLFSLNSILVIIVTALTFFGDELLDAIKNSGLFNRSVLSTAKALRKVRKEFKEMSSEVGTQIATLKQLEGEWRKLKTTAEKTQWIKDNKSNFDSLGVSIRGINDAEKLFIDNTEGMIDALMQRGLAEAAASIAAESYKKAVDKRVDAEYKQMKADKAYADYQAQLRKEERQRAQGKKLPAQGTKLSTGIVGPVGRGQTTYALQSDILKENWQNLAEAAETAGKAYENAMSSGEMFTQMQLDYLQGYKDQLKSMGLLPSAGGGGEGKESDLTSYIENMALRVKKLYDDLIEANEPDELKRRETKITNDYEETLQELQKILAQNENKLAKEHKALTARQIQLIEDSNELIRLSIIENEKKKNEALRQLRIDEQIEALKTSDETMGLIIAAERDNSEKEFTARKQQLINGMEAEILENKKLVEREQQSEYLIRQKWYRLIEDLEIEHNKSMGEIRKRANDMLISTTGATDMRNISAQIDNINIEYSDALDANRQLAEEFQASEASITEVYRRKIYDIYAKYYEDKLELTQAADKAEFDEIARSSVQIQVFELKQERERWKQKLLLAKEGILLLSEEELREAEANIRRIDRELNKSIASAFSNGIDAGLLQLIGFDDDSISAYEDAKQRVIDGLNEVLQAEIEIAEREVELQQEKVDAAQNAYDAEIQARANGYANNVATAKRELQLQKATLAKKQAQAAKYQQAQRALDSAQQASSLVTATANIWSSMSGLGIPGIILAAVSTAAMFAAFIAAKVKAAQVTATYGEGGLEFLEGGSHASGHDIDLGTSNRKGARMHAEGGEAMAIINKRKTRKYRSILPDIVDSLNAGNFEDKYIRANSSLNNFTLVNDKADLSRLERGVDKIASQNNTRTITLSDRIIIYEGNTKRVIKK